ncbi:hypothetical protein HQ520_18900 [bacterium]|nr:hypothetical protein [bacterium]
MPLTRLRKSALLRKTARPAWRAIKYALIRARLLLEPRKEPAVPVRAVTPYDADCFFGYYDKCPWDPTGRYLLCLKTPFRRYLPGPEDTAAICLIDTHEENALREIARTPAWCWQQAAMQQWIGSAPDAPILHNDCRNGRYVTTIRDREGRSQRVLPLPTYAISRDARHALSVDFTRLCHWRPGYGYAATPVPRNLPPHPSDDGIRVMDLDTGESDLVLTYDHLARLQPRPEFPRSMHYINHLEFNPSADRFVFYHRWRNPETGRDKTRMFTARRDGSDLYCLSDHDFVSHYAWMDDRHLLAWAWHPSAGYRYYLFTDRTHEIQILGENILTEDGHPSLSPDGKYLLTDTYPDRLRRRTLILYDLHKKHRTNLARLFVPFNFDGNFRCDLHPRWSRDGKQIAFDSVHEGRRRLYIADLS